MMTNIEMKQTAYDNQYTRLKIVDTSQGDRAIIVPLPLGYRRVPSDVRTILLALQGHRTVTLRAPYDYRKSLRSFLGQKFTL